MLQDEDCCYAFTRVQEEAILLTGAIDLRNVPPNFSTVCEKNLDGAENIVT